MDEVVKLRVGLFLCIKFLPLLNPNQACSQRNVSTNKKDGKIKNRRKEKRKERKDWQVEIRMLKVENETVQQLELELQLFVCN